MLMTGDIVGFDLVMGIEAIALWPQQEPTLCNVCWITMVEESKGVNQCTDCLVVREIGF